jgi:basic amino acid/polyamine antiporter, APA family
MSGTPTVGPRRRMATGQGSEGTRLRRVLGLPSLTFYGVGLILGAGIYSIVGVAAGLAGPSLWLSFTVAALVALATGLSYAELAAMHPRAGADYVYARAAFPRPRMLAPMAGFLLAASAIATSATVSTAFGGYAGLFVPTPAWIAAVGLLLAVTAINLAGVRLGSRANIAMTLAEAAGLVLVVALGWTRPELASVLAVPDMLGVVSAAGLVFFAYLGFEDIANLAEEAKRPERDVPRAILLALALSTVLYLLVAVAAVTLLPAHELARSDAPLADAVSQVHPRLGGMLGGVALFATANTALVALLAASRMLYGIARGGDAPKALGTVWRRTGTPAVASLAALAAALGLLPLARVELLGSLSSLAALGAFTLVHASLLRLRHTRPDQERPFRTPGTVAGVAVVPVLGIAGAVALAASLPWEAWAVLAAVLLVASGAAAAARRLGARA